MTTESDGIRRKQNGAANRKSPVIIPRSCKKDRNDRVRARICVSVHTAQNIFSTRRRNVIGQRGQRGRQVPGMMQCCAAGGPIQP